MKKREVKRVKKARVKRMAAVILVTLGCASSCATPSPSWVGHAPPAERKIASVQSSASAKEARLVESLKAEMAMGGFDAQGMRENIAVYSQWLREFFQVAKLQGSAKGTKKHLLGLLWNARLSLHRQRDFLNEDLQETIADTLTSVERSVRQGQLDSAVAVVGTISDSIDHVRAGLDFF